MSQSQQGQKNIIFFDIDSGSIAAACAACYYDSKGKLIQVRSRYEIRRDIPVLSKDFDRFFHLTETTLEQIAQELLRNASAPIEAIFCNLGAPWISSQLRTVSYERQHAFKVTEQLLKKCEDEERKLPLKRNMDFSRFDDVRLVERKELDVYLNGFPTRKALGQEAKSLEIRSLSSVMSQATQDTLRHLIERVFHREPVFFSNTFFHFSSLKHLLPSENDVLCLDVSGEMTEVLLVKKDHLEEIASFPKGMSDIFRALRGEGEGSLAEVQSLVALYQKGKLEAATEGRFKQEAMQAFRIWFKDCYTLLDELSRKELLPGTIVLSLDRRYASFFEECFLSSQELSTHFHTDKEVRVINLYQRYVEYIQSQGELERFSDAELALLSYVITRVF